MSDNAKTKHIGKLTGGSFIHSQKNNEPTFVGVFEIIRDAAKKGERNAIEIRPGQTVRWWGSLSEEMTRGGNAKVDGTIDGLRACGWGGSNLATVPEQIAEGRLEREVYLTVEHYQGKAKVLYVDEARGGGDGDMSGSQLADVAAKLAERIAALKPKKERRAAAKQPPPDEYDGPPMDDGPPPDDDFPL